MRFLLPLLVACASTRTVVKETTVKEGKLVCDLPPKPMPFKVVGFPERQTLYVTESDLQDLNRFLIGVTVWMSAVDKCLQ